MVVQATPDEEGAKRAKGRKRGRPAADRAGEKGEMISPLSVTHLPPDFDFVASKTADEKIQYIRSVLARSEDEAIAVIAPALQVYGTAASVVEAYMPLILEVKKHVCRPGRPRLNPATGERNRSWGEICNEHFHMGIRRMQQILAGLKEQKLLGYGGTPNRRPPIDRKDYERARQVAAPARSLAEAVVKQGMGDRFPEALEILKLADIPVPVAQPAAIRDGVDKEHDWKAILTELVTTLETYGEKLPVPVFNKMRDIERVLDIQPGQLPPREPVAPDVMPGDTKIAANAAKKIRTGVADVDVNTEESSRSQPEPEPPKAEDAWVNVDPAEAPRSLRAEAREKVADESQEIVRKAARRDSYSVLKVLANGIVHWASNPNLHWIERYDPVASQISLLVVGGTKVRKDNKALQEAALAGDLEKAEAIALERLDGIIQGFFFDEGAEADATIQRLRGELAEMKARGAKVKETDRTAYEIAILENLRNHRPGTGASAKDKEPTATDLPPGDPPKGSPFESSSAPGMDETGQKRNAQPGELPPGNPMAAAPQDAGPLGVASQDAPQPAAAPSPEAKQGMSEEASCPLSKAAPEPPSDCAGAPRADAARREEKAKHECPLSDLEIIMKWSQTNWGTAKDIVAQCPDLAEKRVKKVGEMCEQLVAEGRLKATDAPGLRYIGQAGEYYRELRKKGVREVWTGSGNSRQRVLI